MNKRLSEIVVELNACDGNLLDFMELLKLDPKVHFKGGDWRGCSFKGLRIEGFDLTHSRLHDADFTGAYVARADFTGADLGFRSTLHLAADNWQDAILEDHQRRHLKEQEAKAGAGPNVWQYVALIRDSGDYDEAQAHYRRMLNNDVRPNAHIYATLVDRVPADNWEEARRWLEEARQQQVELDEAAYGALIRKAPFEDAEVFFAGLRDADQLKTTYPFVAICDRSPGLGEAERYLQEMERSIGLDARAVNAAIKTPWDRRVAFERALFWIRCAAEVGSSIETKDVAALVRVAKYDKGAKQEVRANKDRALTLFEEFGLPRDAQIVNALISTADTVGMALNIYDEEVAGGFEPDTYTFRALRHRECSFDEALPVLARMRDKEEPFDNNLVNWLEDKLSTEARLTRVRKASTSGPEGIIRSWVSNYAHPSTRQPWLQKLFPSPQDG